MKKRIIAICAAAAMCALCVPVLSGCSAEVAYKLETAEDGGKYYSVSASGYLTALDGELVIPEYYGEGEDRYPVKEIAEQGFSGASITSLTLPATIEKIGTAAFGYNRNLTTITFADGIGLDEIAWGAFGFCQSLKSVDVPKTVKTLDGMCFTGCSSLQDITLPDGLEYINQRAFEGCSALKGIEFPSTLVRIGSRAFYNCSALEGIILPDGMHGEVQPVLDGDGNQATDENGDPQTVYLPAIGYAAFHTCTSLKTAVIGEGVEELSEGTFGYCQSLEAVYLPSTLKEIKGALFSGDSIVCGHAFHNDPALKTVYFAGSQSGWEAITIDNTPRSQDGARYDNSALISAEKVFDSPYAG